MCILLAMVLGFFSLGIFIDLDVYMWRVGEKGTFMLTFSAPFTFFL